MKKAKYFGDSFCYILVGLFIVLVQLCAYDFQVSVMGFGNVIFSLSVAGAVAYIVKEDYKKYKEAKYFHRI